MKLNKDLKRFFGKCALLLIPLIFYCPLCYYTDAFNVFMMDRVHAGGSCAIHVLKINYLIKHPGIHDAFIFGSSRAGRIPIEYLQKNDSSTWYNMYYTGGVLEEHLEDLNILVENGVPIRKIIVTFDEISLKRLAKDNSESLFCKPYSEYIRLGWKFYLPYLVQFDIDAFIARLFNKENTDFFYGNGGNIIKEEDLLPAKISIDFPSVQKLPFKVSFETLLAQIQEIKNLCEQNRIEVLFVSNPLWKQTYIDACGFGYLDFLHEVAEITPFVNFSCLNEITSDGRNYQDGSHYRPNVGLLMLEILCGASERTEELASSQFGVLVTCDNVDSVIASLRDQLDSM